MGVVEATRAFVRTMRKGNKITQDEVAAALGVTPKSYRDYEKGNTQDLRLGDIAIVLHAVGGTFADLHQLDREDATAADGEALAAARLREAAGRAVSVIEAITAYVHGQDVDELDELREKARAATPQRRARAIAAVRLLLEE